MIEWRSAKNLVIMSKNIRRKKSDLSVGITKSGAMTISAGLRDKLLEKNKKIQYAHAGYLEDENLIMIQFLAEGKKDGARKITNMQARKGTSAFSAKAFFNQMGLDYSKLYGKYDVEPIEELDGEWWFFRLK